MRIRSILALAQQDFPESNRDITVAVDFDGVLNKSDGPYTANHFGPPIPEGMKLLHMLVTEHFNVVILTARKETDSVSAWLARQGFKYLLVTNHKIPARIYVDDRGFSFGKGTKAEHIMKYVRNPDKILPVATR